MFSLSTPFQYLRVLIWSCSFWLPLSAQTDFKDVAGIFNNRCSSCHNNYTHGVPLLNYSQVNAHKAEISIMLNSGYMPHWLPDTTYRRFYDEQTISQTEKTKILNWINSGATKGDTTLAALPPVYKPYRINGTADLELKIPNFVINAYGGDSHDCFVIPTNLLQDRIIRAFEIVPGNAPAVHHVIAAIDTTGSLTSDLSGTCSSLNGTYSFGGCATSGVPTIYPSQGPLKLGLRLKAGSNIVLNIHYEAGSGGQTDSTKIRLFFYPQGTTAIRQVQAFTIHNGALYLAPDQQTPTFAYFPQGGTLPSDISVFSIFPHSHKLCTRVKDFAYTATDTIPLIKMNSWDFNWQGWYTYPKLVKVPAGYRLAAWHLYDNTTANPNNPNNPPMLVLTGKSDNDEMLVDAVQYVAYQPGDELINIDSLLNSDPLIETGVQESLAQQSLQVLPYPNPSGGPVHFRYQVVKAGPLHLSIYNLRGDLVRDVVLQGPGEGEYEWTWDLLNNGGSLTAAGTYFYTFRSSQYTLNGKLVILPTGEK